MFFSFGLSLAVIMEGYDTNLLSNFYGIPAFAQKFGHATGLENGTQQYEVSATWQTALGNSTAAAQIIGLFINGILSERIGYRKMMIGSLAFIVGAIFITFFAVDVQMLLAGYVMSGLPWYVSLFDSDPA
jgi:MFS transporter, SP family, general alpha glucoside:H+ symporter